MIGVTVAALLSCSSLLLGVLCMHWQADSLVLLNAQPSHADLLQAANYYAHLAQAPPRSYVHLLLATGTLQMCILGYKMFVRQESNWLFDGASLCTSFPFSNSVLVLASGVLYTNKLHPRALSSVL